MAQHSQNKAILPDISTPNNVFLLLFREQLLNTGGGGGVGERENFGLFSKQ